MLARIRRLGDDTGAAVVEFALVSVLLFTLLFAIIDLGFGFFSWTSLGNAAREGARRAAVDPSIPGIVGRFNASAAGLNPAKLTVTVTCSAAGTAPFVACVSPRAGDVIRVDGQYQYDFMTPIGSMTGVGSSMTVKSSSESRFEG